MSCSACTRLYLGQLHVLPHDAPRESPVAVRAHHDEITSLCQAALSGCRICIDLWRYFFKEKSPQEYAQNPFFEGQLAVQLYFHSGTKYRFLEPGPSPLGEVTKANSLILEFILNSPMMKVVETKKFVFEKVDPNKRLFTYSGSIKLNPTNSGYMNMLDSNPRSLEEKRWNLVQTWINTCSSSHSICQTRYRSPGFFPTRVIHIPFGPMAPEMRYHLIDTTSLSPTGLGSQYVTLSHCWGNPKDPPYRTTAQNVAKRLRTGIARNDLPPTFKDAIDTALRLRAPFLWIDSLCIVQGDKDDWAVECTKMADVYMNSFLNISATSAKSSQDGLSSSYELHPRIVKTGWNDGRAGMYRLIDLDFWRERVIDAEINTRGWVLQERCLAQRVLHFGFDQLLWECCELSASEEFPDGMPTNYVGGYVGGQLDFKQTTNLVLPPSRPTNPDDPTNNTYRKFHSIWQQLGNMYGRCELTEPDKDKLVAISGLARVIQQRLDDEYLAGLWKKNLIGDLLWKVDKTQRLIRGTVPDGIYEKRWDFSKRAVEYRAPSWSWASVDGLVKFGDFTDLFGTPEIIEEGDSAFSVTASPMASILDVSTLPVLPDDPFGQVKDGKLIIRGQLHRLGSTFQFMSPIMTFREDGEVAFDDIDEPVSSDVYKEAYFLPLTASERRWVKLPQTLIDQKKRLQELSNSPSVRHTETVSNQESETPTFHVGHIKEELRELQVDREDYYDRVAGIEICPTKDRKAFRRIGCMEVSVQRFRKLGGYMRFDELSTEPGSENVCRPDAAATQGNIITGIFEIV